MYFIVYSGEQPLLVFFVPSFELGVMNVPVFDDYASWLILVHFQKKCPLSVVPQGIDIMVLLPRGLPLKFLVVVQLFYCTSSRSRCFLCI